MVIPGHTLGNSQVSVNRTIGPTLVALVTSLVVLFYCCVTADILTKLLQQCFLIFIVVPWLYLGNSQVSVYRTIGPTLVTLKSGMQDLGHSARTC